MNGPCPSWYKNLGEALVATERIRDTYPYQNIPSSAFIPAEQTAQSAEADRIWNLTTSLLSRAKRAFEGNEPEGSWIRLASDLLDGIFGGIELEGLLRTIDVQYSDINSITLLPTVNDVAIPVKKADLAVAIHQHLLRCGNDQYLHESLRGLQAMKQSTQYTGQAEGVHRASRGSTQGTARESAS